MKILKELVVVSLLLGLSVFTGCQGNNGEQVGTDEDNNIIIDTGGSEVATIVLPVTTNEVTTNSEVVNVITKVFDGNNNPFTTGNVKVVSPNDVLTGRDIGSFAALSASPDATGTANFTYTAPGNLNEDMSDIVFTFYHDSDPTAGVTYTVTITPEVNQTVLTNYTLEVSDPDNITMGIEDNKLLNFTVKDDSGNPIADSSMASMTITSLNPALGTLTNDSGTILNVDTLTIDDRNEVTVNVTSYTSSGLNSIQVDTTFTDVNGNDQNISKVFNVVILSGPPSAMSLSYAGTEQDTNRAKFIETWVLTVVDKYNNPVDSNPGVTMGMIAGYAQDSSSTAANAANYLYFNPGTATGGLLNATSDDFTAQNGVFDDVDFDNEVLVTFGNGYTYPASGKWDIDPATSTSNVLGLQDDYINLDTDELGFAVGNNFRQDVCDPGIEWVANVYPENNNFLMNDQGSLRVKVEYDYYLVGKSTVLWVNLIGKDYVSDETVKIGESRKVTLRGQALESIEYAYGAGFSGVVHFPISITNTPEWYYNANFSYYVQATGDGTVFSVTDTSMVNGITSCQNNGIAYVEVTVTTSAKAGVLSLQTVLPSREF